MWPKNSISSYFGQNSEMQNCQDYTDPTVGYAVAAYKTEQCSPMLAASKQPIQL